MAKKEVKAEPRRAEIKKIGESRNADILEVKGQVISVPKDPTKIPSKSVLVGTDDLTSDVVEFVKKLLAEKKEGGGS